MISNQKLISFKLFFQLIRLNFDEKTGLLSGFEDFKTGRSYNLKQQFFYYRGATNATDHSGLNNQPSG